MLKLTKTLEVSSSIKVLLIFLGMPGSGKSTMAQILLLLFKALNHGLQQKEFRLLTMSSLIRQEIDDPTSTLRPLILPHVPSMQAGKLLNDDLTMRTLDKNIVSEFWGGGRIMELDGCVRNIKQGKAILDTNITWELIHLRVDDEQLSLRRIAERAIELKRLDDAKPEHVANRLKDYRDQTYPVLKQFRDQDSKFVHDIDASLEFECRVEVILKALRYSDEKISEMMQELRKPGTSANDLMRVTLKQPPAPRRISIQNEQFVVRHTSVPA